MSNVPTMPSLDDLRPSAPAKRRRVWADLQQPAIIALCTMLFVATWFSFGAVTSMGRALHNDMTEAYVWGREFQWGYNQHPPFWAWIAGLWFQVFPTTDWPFVLLAVINATVGLLGAWSLIGRFANGWTRRAAMALLLCTPFYTFKSYNFNANSIFLSLWPWTLYFFTRSLESRRIGPSALFGAMIGLCLRSKYYTIVLILTCVGASFAHPDWRLYYRSARPWVAIGIAAALFLPHVVWAAMSHAPPVEYALGITGLGMGVVARNTVNFLLEITAFNGVVLAIVILSRRSALAGSRRVDGWGPDVLGDPRGRFLSALVFLPVLFTVLFGLALELQVGGKMVIGIFPLLPLWLLRTVPALDARRCFRIAASVAIVTASAALMIAPALTLYTFNASTRDPSYTLPQKELAAAATTLWHSETNAKLRYVGGSKFIGSAVAFYSEDKPEGLVLLSFHQAPWVTPDKVYRDGLLAVCLHNDPDCAAQAERLSDADTRRSVLTLRHEFWGYLRDPVPVDVFITPPHSG